MPPQYVLSSAQSSIPYLRLVRVPGSVLLHFARITFYVTVCAFDASICVL